MGRGCQYLTNGLKNGAQAQKILANAEHVPNDCDLIFVGYSSIVTR